MYSFITVIIVVQSSWLIASRETNEVKHLFESKGDLNIGLILNKCQNSTAQIPILTDTIINSAIWTTQRIQFLEMLSPLTLGIKIYEACSVKDYYEIIFHSYLSHEEDHLLGLITDQELDRNVRKFTDALKIEIKITKKFSTPLVQSSVALLNVLDWTDNITLIAPTKLIVKDFFESTREKLICVKDYIIYRNNCSFPLENVGQPLIIFGDNYNLIKIIQDHPDLQNLNTIFVPTDGSILSDLYENSYIILPAHLPLSKSFDSAVNISPSPLLFEIAEPIFMYTENIKKFLSVQCNETSYKLNCLRNRFLNIYKPKNFTIDKIVELLKIEPLKNNFVYDVYKVENSSNITQFNKKNNIKQPYTKLFSYNIFDNNLTSIFNIDQFNTSTKRCLLAEIDCQMDCKNFEKPSNSITSTFLKHFLEIRSESWVFVFLALSVLGILFCIAILCFLFTCICRKDILEGNPILTILLLLTVLFLYCAVLPYTVKDTNSNKNVLCLVKTLWTTLSFSAAFSLILARGILLSTVSKEIAFMSHIPGSVQSFLTLFIFGVQTALSIQIVGRCTDIFHGISFIYVVSYNTVLLLLMLCLCPLIYKSQRNYREGKYFTIAITLTTTSWCIWLPCYALLDPYWKDPAICFGLVSTASILLGAVFVPRTYLMTISAARDKIASNLPSIDTSTVMDIYRANPQQIYDCVNIAAINAISVARAGLGSQIHSHNFYNCPTLPQDEDIDFDEHLPSPINNDKITRF